MAHGGENAAGRRKKGHHELGDVVGPLGGRHPAPGKGQPGREVHRKASPSDEHDQEAAVACHGLVQSPTRLNPNTLPRLRGRVSVWANRLASSTVTSISFTLPARYTLTVWV